MYTYRIRLAPKPGAGTGNLTTDVRANSDTEARRLAEAQCPNHQVEVVQKVNS